MNLPNILFGKFSLSAKGPAKILRENPAFDAAGRRWPIVEAPPQNRISELEDTIAKLSAEVNLRCAQVADLYNIQQERANDVIDACDEIDCLGKTIDVLQGTIAQRETQAAAAEKKAIELENENSTLRLELDKARKEVAKLSQRLLSVETAFNDRVTSFNDRELSIVAAQERNSRLNDELNAKWHDATRLIATVEKANEERRNKFNRQCVQLHNKIKSIEAVAAEQNAQAENLEVARAMLVELCDSLTKTLGAIESMKAESCKGSVTQARCGFEPTLVVNRESSTTTPTECAVEHRSERSAHSSAESISVDRRENTVVHLPNSSALRARAS